MTRLDVETQPRLPRRLALVGDVVPKGPPMSNTPPLNGLTVNGPPTSRIAIILAHGAGAGKDSDFLNAFAVGIAGHGFRVVRFEFPYMAERRQSGKRRPPDREPVLRQHGWT